MVFFKVTFTYLASYYLAYLRNSVVRDLRLKIYNKILSLPIGFFTEEHKGDIMARISGDVTEVEISVISSLEMILKNPIIIMV
jgi:subfamily B ATP-binding cassette protein MsbA